MNKKKYISHMTWLEIQKIVDTKPTVLIPIGTVETQNLHNPTGYDYLIAERLSEEVAEKSNSIITPVLPFGYSDNFFGFPGTISLRASTLELVIEDITVSLIKTGFDHFLFINNHAPNKPFLNLALNKIRNEYGIISTSVWPTALARHFAKELFENPKEVLTHGNEPSTSLLKYLCPELIREDLSKENYMDKKYQNFKLLSSKDLEHQGQAVSINLRLKDIDKQGGWGNPKGDKEKGKVMFTKMVDYIVTFIDRYNNLRTNIGK